MPTAFRPGLRPDDFAWLGLLRDVHSFHDVLHALFDPAAQGTIRPWSERGFFLLFETLFGLDSLPFRICVFVTMAADRHAGRLDHPPDHRIARSRRFRGNALDGQHGAGDRDVLELRL